MHCDLTGSESSRNMFELYKTCVGFCSCVGSVVQQISCVFWVRRPSRFGFGDLLLSPTATKAKLAQRRASEVHIRDLRRPSELD